MKTIFDKTTRDEVIQRVRSLNEHSTAQWGKMNVYQMLKHCVLCEEMYQEKKHYNRTLLGRLIGKMALKNLLSKDLPLQKNAPTRSEFKINKVHGEIAEEKERWIKLIEEYAHYPDKEFTHWFFGKMTKEQVGYFVFKHTDHHLRQFNQ
jgi:hypothetical protein